MLSEISNQRLDTDQPLRSSSTGQKNRGAENGAGENPAVPSSQCPTIAQPATEARLKAAPPVNAWGTALDAVSGSSANPSGSENRTRGTKLGLGDGMINVSFPAVYRAKSPSSSQFVCTTNTLLNTSSSPFMAVATAQNFGMAGKISGTTAGTNVFAPSFVPGMQSFGTSSAGAAPNLLSFSPLPQQTFALSTPVSDHAHHHYTHNSNNNPTPPSSGIIGHPPHHTQHNAHASSQMVALVALSNAPPSAAPPSMQPPQHNNSSPATPFSGYPSWSAVLNNSANSQENNMGNVRAPSQHMNVVSPAVALVGDSHSHKRSLFAAGVDTNKENNFFNSIPTTSKMTGEVESRPEVEHPASKTCSFGSRDEAAGNNSEAADDECLLTSEDGLTFICKSKSNPLHLCSSSQTQSPAPPLTLRNSGPTPTACPSRGQSDRKSQVCSGPIKTPEGTATTTQNVLAIDDSESLNRLKIARSHFNDLCNVFPPVDALYAFAETRSMAKLPEKQELAAIIVKLDRNSDKYRNFVSYFNSLVNLFPMDEFRTQIIDNFVMEDCTKEMDFLKKMFIRVDNVANTNN